MNFEAFEQHKNFDKPLERTNLTKFVKQNRFAKIAISLFCVQMLKTCLTYTHSYPHKKMLLFLVIAFVFANIERLFTFSQPIIIMLLSNKK